MMAQKRFEDFLEEYFFDLHYQPKPDAKPVNLGQAIFGVWQSIIQPKEPYLVYIGLQLKMRVNTDCF